MKYASITATVAIAALLLEAPAPFTIVAVTAAVAHLAYETASIVRQWRALG
jgi:hypothetical protein